MDLIGNFKDSSNIKIEDGIPKYHYEGFSFRDKLKNGLTLDHVLELENYCASFETNISIIKRVKFADCLTINIVFDSSEFEIYEQDFVFPKARKGKWNHLKKMATTNFKKDRRNQLGYDDKLFNLEQNTIFDFDSEEIDGEYYDDDSSYSNPQGYYHIVRQVKVGEGWWYD